MLEQVEREWPAVFVLFLCHQQHRPTENGNVEIKQFEPDPAGPGPGDLRIKTKERSM